MEGNKRGETVRPVSARAGSKNISRQGPRQISETAPIVGRKITNPTVSWNLGALTARVTQSVSQSPEEKRESPHLVGAERKEGVSAELGAEELSTPVVGNREALYQQRLLELRQKALDIMNGNRASELAPTTGPTNAPESESNGTHKSQSPKANGVNIPSAEVKDNTRAKETGGKKPVQKSPPQKKQAKANVRPFSSLLKESQDRLANIHRLLDAATEESLFAPQRPLTEAATMRDAGEEESQRRESKSPGDSIPFVIQPAGPPPDYVSPELVHIIQANAPDHLDLVDPTTARTFARPNGHPIRTSVDMAFGSVATAPRPQQITRARQANSPVRVGAAMANDGNGRRTGDVVGKQEMRHEGGLNGRSERAAKVEALLAKIQERNSRIAVRKAATEEELGAKQGLLRRGSPQRGSSAVASQSRVGAQSPDRVWGVHGNIRDDEGVSDRRASAEGRSRSAPHQRPVSRGPMVRKMRRSSDDSELGGRIAMDGVRASVLEKVAGRLQRKSRASVKEATALPRERKAAWSEQASGKLKPKRKFAGTRARPAGVNILEPLDLQRPATVTGVLEASGNVPGAVLSAGVKSAVRLTEFGQSITSPTLSGWSQDESGAEQSWLYSASGHGLRVNAGAEPADGLDAQNAAPKQGLASLAKGENEGPVLSGVGERPALYPGLSDIRERKQGLEEGGQLASPLVQTFALGVGSSAVGLELDGARWGVAESAKPAPLDGPLVNGEIPSVLALANAETTVGIALSSIEEKAREQVRSALAKRPQSAPSVKRPTQNSKPQVGAVPHPIFGARSHPFLRAPPPKRPFTPPPQAGVNRPPGERRKSTGGADLPGGKRPPSAQSRLGGEEGQLEEGKRKSRLSGGRLDEVRAFMIAQQKGRKTQEAREREMRRVAEEERTKQLKALEQHYPKVSPKPSPPKTRPDWNPSITPPEHTPPPQQNDPPETDSVLAEQGTVIDDVAETIATKTSVQFPGGLNAVSKPELSALLPSSAATFAAGLAAGSAVVRRAGTRVQPLPAKTGPITTAEPVEATLRSWVGGRAVKRPPSEAAKPVLTPAKSPVPRAKPVANLVGVPVKPLVGSGKVAVDVRSPAPVERNGPVQRSEDVRKTEPVRSAQSVRSTEPIRHPEGVQHSEHVRKLDDLSGAPAELSGSATLATVPVTSAQTQVAALTSAGPEEGAPEREPAGDVQTGSSVFGFGQGTESGTVLTTVPGIDGLGPEFADDPAITAQGLGERKRPSLTVDVTGAVADADGVTLSGRATVSGRKRGGAVEEDGARSPIPDAKARLAMMKEYGRQQRQRRAALDTIRRKKEHERKLAAQALRRKQAERARQAEAARNPPRNSGRRAESAVRDSGTGTEPAVRRSSRPSVSGFIVAERKRKASDRVVRPSERAFRASGGQPPAVEPASEVLVIESGSGWDTKIAHGVERVGVKSPPLRGQRPAKWPDGRRSVRTQAPVLAQPEVNADVSQAGPAEEGPFSDGNRGGTRHVITEGFPVGADVSKVFSSAPQGRPGTAPSRIAGTFVRTLGAVRKEPSERQGELLSPWSVPSVEESLLFEGIYAEVPRGESGRALSATKMLQSDGLAVMTWQRPEPRQGGWVGGSESEIAQSDVRTGVEKFSPIRPRVKRNGKPVRGLVKKVSVPKKASFASDFDADTESLTPDSVVDAASEPDRLRRRLARKRRAAKWPQGEGWEREVLAKAETDRRLDVLKGMAARIAKRLEALAFSGGEGSRAELAPEIEAIVGQAEKLLRGVDARGRTGGDDPPGKARTPKKRKARKRGLSMGRALGGLGSPLAGKRLSTSPERSGVRFKRDTIEASADKGPKTSAEDRRPASGVADVAVTSQQSLSDDASLFSPMERSQSALSVGVNSDGALRIGPNVQTAGGFSHPFAETSVLASAVTTQGSEQERAAGSAADESVASDVGGGDDVIADLDAEIQQLLQSRRLDPAARVGTGSESLKGSAGPAGSRIGVGESSAEQRWAALVGPGERSDSEGSEEETGEESSAEEKSRRVAPLAHVSKSPRGLVPGARPPSADVSRGAQGFPIGGGLLSDLYSDSEEEEESDSGPSRSADRLTSQTRAGSEEQAWASRKRVEQVSNVDVTRVSADVSTEPKKITVKQLLESSGDALLDEAVPARVPPLLERTPAETKGDRLSIVHLYEKQLRERMERQQRQLAELERKRKEDERNEAERNARAERDATAERDERAERVARAEREANAEVAGERWGLAGEEKDGIPAAVRRNEEERKEEERKRSEQHLNEENWKEQEERNLKEERKREEEERNEMEPKRKEAENREAVRQPVVDVAPGQQAVIAPENLVPAGNVPVAFTEGIPPSESRPKGISAKVVELTAKPIAESDDPERGLLVPVKVTGKGWPVKARDGKQTARQKETAIASADGGHVARQDVLEFFPGAKGGLETGRKELLSRATHLVETERRLSPEMLEQMLQTEVARLEETGAIEHEIASLEHARGIAIAHQETVSLARLLEDERNAQERNERAERNAQERNERADRMYREQQEKLKETVERLTREVAADVRKESLEQIRTVADVFAREVRKGAAQQHTTALDRSGQPFRSDSRLGGTEAGARFGPTDHSPENDALHQLRFYSSNESESGGGESTGEKDDVRSDVEGEVREEIGSVVQSESYLQSESYSRGFEEVESESGVSERVSEPVSGGVDARVGESVLKGVSENMSESVRESVSQGVSEKVIERVSERVSGAVGNAEDDISERIGSRVSERVSEGIDEEAESMLQTDDEMVEERGLVETEVELQWKDLKVVEDDGLANGAFSEEEVLDELEAAEEGPVEEKCLDELEAGAEGPVEEEVLDELEVAEEGLVEDEVDWDQVDEEEVRSQEGENQGLEKVGGVETEESIKEESQQYSDSFGQSVGAQMPSSGDPPDRSAREQNAPGGSDSRGTDERETAARLLHSAAEKLRTAEEALFEKKRTLEERTRGEIAALGRSADGKAAVRQQKLLRLRLDADLADVDRALASMRAEFVRQRLAWEQSSDASAVRRSELFTDPDDVSADVSSAILETETRNTAGDSVGEEVDTEVGSRSAAQSGGTSGVSEAIESGTAEESGLGLREAVEISATAFSSIAVRRIEIELERAREEAAALQKEKREREIQDEIQRLNDAVTEKRAAIMAASAPSTPAAQTPKPWAPLADARPLPPLEPMHVPPKPFEPSQSDSLPHSEPGSVAYSDSFVGAESAKTGSSRRESDVPSEALSVGEQQQPQISSGVAGKDEASESVRYSDTFDQAGKDEASDSVRYSDTFNQAGNSEPVASVATESGDGTNARWDEEVTSAMERSATSATLQAPARPAGTDGWDGVPEANVTGEGRDVKGRHLDLTGLRPEASWGQVIETHGAEVLGKEIFGESTGEVTGVLIGEITGEEESVEELPEEWSEESTGVAREQAEKDPALKSASLDPLTRAFDATEVSARGQFQDAASAAVTGPEKPEGVPAGSAKPAGRQEVRRLSEAVASEPDEYSDSFASEADVEDDVSSVPIRDTWRDDVAGEGGDEAGESGRAVAALGAAEGLEGSKDGLGGFEEGLEDGVSAWETKESPGAVPGASMFATLKRPRRNVPGTAEKDGMAESFEEADRIENEITGVESLEEVEEELEFDEDGFEVRAENGEEAGVKTGGADVGGTGNSLMSKREGSASDEIGNEVGKLRGVEKERLVKAADGVLEDLVAAEVEDATASPPVSPTRRIRTRLLNPRTSPDGEGASPPSPRSPGSPSRPVFDSEARWINPQNLSPRNSPRSSPPLHVPLGIGPLGPFEQDASAVAATHSPHSPDSGSPTRQSLRASFEAAQNPETLVGMSRLSPKDFAELSRESPLPEELEEGFEGLEPNPLAVDGDAAYVEDYVSEVLRVSGFLEPGAAAWYRPNQPLGLDVFVRLEKVRPDVHDFQHIFNKLVFDAVGEALLKELTPYKPREPWERAPKPLKPPPDAAALLAAVRNRTLGIFKRRAPVGPLKEEALRLMMKEQPWVGFPEEELEVGCEVADLMVNDMVDEVVELLLRAQRGRQSKRQAGIKAVGRSRRETTL